MSGLGSAVLEEPAMRLIAAILTAAALLAAPANPAPAQAQTLSADSVASMSGTVWRGRVSWSNGESMDMTLTFQPDGVLVFAYNGGSWPNGRWVQNDRVMTFELNGHYAVYSGVLSADGMSVTGRSYNRVGATGDFRFTRSGPT